MAEVINIATFDFDMDLVNKSLTEYQTRLFELQKEQKRYADQNKALETQIKSLTKTKQELTASGQQESKQYQEVEAKLKSLDAQQKQVFINQRNLQTETGKVRSEYNSLVKVQQTLMDSNGKLRSSTDAYTQALQKEIKTKADAKKNNSELIKLADQLDLSIEGNVEVLNELNKKIDENTKFIKENSSATQQQTMNIGNYQQDVKEALNELNLFNGGLAGFSSRASQAGGAGALLSNSLRTATSATIGLTKAVLSFIATPLGVILTAIVAVFALVRNAMNRSEESTNKLKVAFSAVSGIINQLMKWLQPLGEFLIDGIVAGFELATKAAETAIKIIGGGLKLLGFESAGNAVLEFGNAMAEAAKDAQTLALMEQELEKSQRKARLTQLQYQKEAESFRQIRDDETKSIKERIQANEDLGKVLEKQLQEELRIAKLALDVANLRIKAEGETSTLLDAQADALTNIADIEERINGQRSEQLRNQVSLQKQAHEKYMAQLDAQIKKQKEQLDLWILQQGDRAKTLQEQLDLDRQIANKSIAILDAELKAKKISREKYDADVLKIRMDLAKQETLIVEENAKRELDLLIKNTDRQLEERKRLNGEELILIAQQEDAKLAFELTRFQQGLINETEYQANRLAIQEEYLKKETDLKAQFDEQQRADRLLRDELEVESRLLNLEDTAWNEFERQQIILDEQYQIEQEKLQEQYDSGKISYENFLQAQKNLTQDYANQDAEIAKLKEQYKLDIASQTYGNLAAIAGKESAAGKAFATAGAIIDTYKSAVSSYNSLSGIPIVGPALGAIAAGAAIKMGLDNVKKINATKTPNAGGISNPEVQGFAGGGTVMGGSSILRNNGDNVLVTARVGETFINESQRSFLGNDILGMAGVPGLAPSDNAGAQNYSGLSEIIADAVYKGSLMGTNEGSRSGMVQASENRQIQNQSTFE